MSIIVVDIYFSWACKLFIHQFSKIFFFSNFHLLKISILNKQLFCAFAQLKNCKKRFVNSAAISQIVIFNFGYLFQNLKYISKKLTIFLIWFLTVTWADASIIFVVAVHPAAWIQPSFASIHIIHTFLNFIDLL